MYDVRDKRGETVGVKATLLKDFLDFLKRQGLYEKLVRGELKCSACGKTLNANNIGAVYITKSGELKIFCDDIKCLMEASEAALEENLLWEAK